MLRLVTITLLTLGLAVGGAVAFVKSHDAMADRPAMGTPPDAPVFTARAVPQPDPAELRRPSAPPQAAEPQISQAFQSDNHPRSARPEVSGAPVVSDDPLATIFSTRAVPVPDLSSDMGWDTDAAGPAPSLHVAVEPVGSEMSFRLRPAEVWSTGVYR